MTKSSLYPAHVAEPLPTHGKLVIVKAFLEQICAGRGRVLQGITGSLRAQSNPVRIRSVALSSRDGNWRRTIERNPNLVALVRRRFLQWGRTGSLNLLRRLWAAGSPSFFPLVNGSAKPTNGISNRFSLSPVLSSACLHANHLSMEKTAWRPKKFSISNRKDQ